MPRPRSLSPSAVAAAALAIIDRDGLAQLSMRTVAAELGVAPMSLYRYVESRDELEGVVLESVVGAVDISTGASTAWRERVDTLVRRVRAAIRAHPALVPLLLTRRQSSAGSVRWGEAMMHALADGGFRGGERAIAFRTLVAYLLGAVQLEHYGPLAGAGTEMLANLTARDFPYLSETARSARTIPSDEEFRRGLGLVLDGLDRVRRRQRQVKRG
jgi:AcrR family transcriptional regulator